MIFDKKREISLNYLNYWIKIISLIFLINRLEGIILSFEILKFQKIFNLKKIMKIIREVEKLKIAKIWLQI